MTKKQAGQLGGLATLKKHGKEHMRAIGRKGAEVFHSRYHLQPYGIGDFIIVNRKTSEVVNTLSGYWRR